MSEFPAMLSLAHAHPAQTIAQLVTHVPEAYQPVSAIRDADHDISYQQLFSEVSPIAQALLANGVQKGDRVAVWAPNSVHWVLIALAIHLCGGILVPLNTRMKGHEAQYILRNSGCRLLFSVGTFLQQDYPAALAEEGVLDELMCVLFPEAHSQVIASVDWDVFLASGTSMTPENVLARASSVCASDFSDLLFTSGTTGQPKGVLCTHGGTIKAFRTYAQTLALGVSERYLIVNPFFHAFGYKAGWVTALLAGCTILPEAVFDAKRVMQRVAVEQVNILPGPPTLYTSIMADPSFGKIDLSSLRVAVTGSASVSPSLIEQMRNIMRIENVLTAYGLTECGGLATMCAPDDSAEIVARTSGKAIAGTELRIFVDGQFTDAAGRVGEICLRGYHIMHGYWQNEAATEATIDDQGWLHTGDLGQLDAQGNLLITGRLKDMYICGGFNCYPAEIEAMMQRHPDIQEVAVVGIPDARMGEVGCAFILPRGAAKIDTEVLIAWCREHMANYKVPRQIRVVESLPMNASNKVLKHELQKMCE